MARFNIEFHSKSLMRKVEFNLFIPSLLLRESMKAEDNYYQNNNKKFPLLILLSGFSDSYRAWQSNTHIETLCDKYQVAACFIGGDNRWYLNLGPLDKWDDFLEKDLPDYLYGTFSNLDKEQRLIIGGVSMGGYGALYHGLKYPGKYAACFALSPATKPDFVDESKYGTLKDLFLQNKDNLLPIYLCIGSKDFIIEQSMKFNDWFIENDIDVRYKVIEGGDHSYNLWRNQLDDIFLFLEENSIIKKI